MADLAESGWQFYFLGRVSVVVTGHNGIWGAQTNKQPAQENRKLQKVANVRIATSRHDVSYVKRNILIPPDEPTPCERPPTPQIIMQPTLIQNPRCAPSCTVLRSISIVHIALVNTQKLFPQPTIRIKMHPTLIQDPPCTPSCTWCSPLPPASAGCPPAAPQARSTGRSPRPPRELRWAPRRLPTPPPPGTTTNEKQLRSRYTKKKNAQPKSRCIHTPQEIDRFKQNT